MSESHDIIKKPLTLWEKAKASVKGFVGTAMDYLPRGLVFSGMIVGGLALAGSMGIDPFSMGLHEYSGAQIAGRVALHAMIGSVIAGGIGAYAGLKLAHQERETEMAAQGEQLKRAQSLGQERQQEYSAGFVPQGDLPLPSHKLTGKAQAHTFSLT